MIPSDYVSDDDFKRMLEFHRHLFIPVPCTNIQEVAKKVIEIPGKPLPITFEMDYQSNIEINTGIEHYKIILMNATCVNVWISNLPPENYLSQFPNSKAIANLLTELKNLKHFGMIYHKDEGKDYKINADAYLEAISNLQIDSLSLEGVGFNTKGARVISNWLQKNYLESLVLIITESPDFMKNLDIIGEQLSTNTSLEVLNLDARRLDDSNASFLLKKMTTALEKNSTLKSLYLSDWFTDFISKEIVDALLKISAACDLHIKSDPYLNWYKFEEKYGSDFQENKNFTDLKRLYEWLTLIKKCQKTDTNFNEILEIEDPKVRLLRLKKIELTLAMLEDTNHPICKNLTKKINGGFALYYASITDLPNALNYYLQAYPYTHPSINFEMADALFRNRKTWFEHFKESEFDNKSYLTLILLLLLNSLELKNGWGERLGCQVFKIYQNLENQITGNTFAFSTKETTGKSKIISFQQLHRIAVGVGAPEKLISIESFTAESADELLKEPKVIAQLCKDYGSEEEIAILDHMILNPSAYPLKPKQKICYVGNDVNNNSNSNPPNLLTLKTQLIDRMIKVHNKADKTMIIEQMVDKHKDKGMIVAIGKTLLLMNDTFHKIDARLNRLDSKLNKHKQAISEKVTPNKLKRKYSSGKEEEQMETLLAFNKKN